MIHFYFDLISLFMAFFISRWFRNKYQIKHQLIEDEENYYWYMLVAVVGLFVGAYLFGTANLYLSERAGIGKSFLGGVFGAVLCVEIFKSIKGFKHSTGLYYIVGLCVLIIIGRFGCFFSGLNDYTYGVETQSVFGYDFGDGLKRHPVQLYESFSLLLFLIVMLVTFVKHRIFWINKGFYLFILVYATQRFIWEFLKPYKTLFLQFNIFHILTILLMLWSTYKLMKKS